MGEVDYAHRRLRLARGLFDIVVVAVLALLCSFGLISGPAITFK